MTSHQCKFGAWAGPMRLKSMCQMAVYCTHTYNRNSVRAILGGLPAAAVGNH